MAIIQHVTEYFNIISYVFFIFLSACSFLGHRLDRTKMTAQQGNLVFKLHKLPNFDLTLFLKGLIAGQNHLVVCIEEDGLAWRRKHRVTQDPTPEDPLTLRLVTRDPNSAILCIARPCQYQNGASSP